MTENEFLLQDRLQKIQQIIDQYGEENFYISFSGGKDSTVLSDLIDRSLPGNNIPRVYANTGIEYQLIYKFVLDKSKKDNRFIIVKPSVNIIDMLKRVGYPFKSKKHSSLLETYQKYKTTENRPGIQHYLHISNDGINWSPQNSCPDKLRFQFTPDYPLKISDRCCDELKKKPLHNWAKKHKKPYTILGIRRAEGGRRHDAKCIVLKGNKLDVFQPIAPMTNDWIEWYIDTFRVDISDIYKDPYNFDRTGCKGCPFAINLQKELDTLEKHFPNERKQCETIWKPVYDEYRRIGYRLKEDTEDEQSNNIRN